MTLTEDILAILESSKLPLTLDDICQDVAVMPVGRGEPMRKVKPEIVQAEVERLVQSGQVVIAGKNVYRLRVAKGPTQRSFL